MLINDLLEILNSEFKEINWTLPSKFEHGLLTTNYAFTKSKQNKVNPIDIAKETSKIIQEFLSQKGLAIEVQMVGPYINLVPKADYYSDFLNLNPLEQEQKNTPVMLEYVSVNVAKPIHAGHMRNMNIGEALFRLLSLKFTDILTDNHWGDWGVQFGIIIWAIKELKEKTKLEVEVNESLVKVTYKEKVDYTIDELVAIYVWGNQQEAKQENWKEKIREEFLRLEQYDKENRSIWQRIVKTSQAESKKILNLWNVTKHDLEQGESYYEDEMKKLTEFLDCWNIWKKEEKARYIDLEDLLELWKDIPLELAKRIKNFGRCYLVSSKGYTSYAFRDVAARLQWARDYRREIMITLTDYTQTHNFDQAFAIAAYIKSHPEYQKEFGLLNFAWNQLIHVPYGFLKLQSGKMSSRKGNFLNIDVIYNTVFDRALAILKSKNPDLSNDEAVKRAEVVTIAAIKWYDLSKDSIHEVVLDIDKILSFEGNTGVYQLYTIVRLNSIIKNCSNVKLIKEDFDTALLNTKELAILQLVYQTQLIIKAAIKNYKPHILVTHLHLLATKINSWYTEVSVKSERDIKRQKTLLLLCLSLIQFHKKSLNLLAIDTLTAL